MNHLRTASARWLMGGLLGLAWLGCESSGGDAPPAGPVAANVSTGVGRASGAGDTTAAASDTSPSLDTSTAPAAGAATGAMGAAEQNSGAVPLSPASSPASGAGMNTGSGAGTPSGAASGGSAGAAPAAPGGETPACPSAATTTPGERTESLSVGGQNRSYLLHVPAAYTGKTPVPVVFDFHGLGGNGVQQRNLSGWAAVADREGFIMVYPNGSSNAWNVGRCCPPAADQGVDDVAFVRAVIAQLQREACIDAKRIYASGCSNGGGMSYKLACDAADVIAGVAPVDFDCVVGENNVPSCGGCNPGRPISEIQFRATGDALVAYNGGPAPIPQGMDFPGAQQNFSDWGGINSCTGAAQAVPGRAACQTFPSCGDGVDTTLCTRQGGSHCGNYQALDIANTAWEQLQRTSLP
jgi:polyhydroxybutyrate depolymerase